MRAKVVSQSVGRHRYIRTYIRTYVEHRGNGRRRYSVVKRGESARACSACRDACDPCVRACARARARVGETGLERIPFIDVGTRRTRKRKGRRCGTVKERGGRGEAARQMGR